VHASLGRYDSAAAAMAPAFEANPKRGDYARRYADYLASANDFERLREALEKIDRMETPPPISDATRRLALRRSARLVGAYHANDLIDDWRETEAAFGFAPTTDFSAETSLFVAERFETNDALFAVVAYWKPSEWAVARGGVAKGFERTFLPAWRLEASATAYPLDGASVFVGFTYFEFDRERVRLYSGGVEAGLWRGSYARAILLGGRGRELRPFARLAWRRRASGDRLRDGRRGVSIRARSRATLRRNRVGVPPRRMVLRRRVGRPVGRRRRRSKRVVPKRQIRGGRCFQILIYLRLLFM